MSCFVEFFSCLRSRKHDKVRGSSGVEPLIPPPVFLIHTLSGSSFSTAGGSSAHLLPLPPLPQRTYAAGRGMVYPNISGGSAASVDYFSDETYAILMKKQEESFATRAPLYGEDYKPSWPKLDAEIRDMLGSGRESWDISNDDICLKPLPKIYTGAMSPVRTPSPLKTSVAASELEPSSPFLSLLEEYDPSPVKHTTPFGKSGTYREATLSLSTEWGDVGRGKQQGITETKGRLNFRTLYPPKASPGPMRSGTLEDKVESHEQLNSSDRVANDHSSKASGGANTTSDLNDKKKPEDPSANTIGVSLSGEERPGARQKLHTVPSDDVNPSESTTNILSFINFSHLRALVAPSESNLTSTESLLSYGLNSSNFCKENFYTPSEIGALEESANLLSSVQNYHPSPPIDGSSIYSSEYTSAPSLVGMGGSSANVPCLTFSPTPDGSTPNQTQNPYQATDTEIRKKFSPGPIFYPPAGRARPLDIGTATSIYPDRFPDSLHKSGRGTDRNISEKHVGNDGEAGDSPKNTQTQSRRSPYGAVAAGVGGSRSIIAGAPNEEYCKQSDFGSLQTASYGLNPPGTDGPQAVASSKGCSKAILAAPTYQLTVARRLKSSISLGDRLRGHGRRNGDAGTLRRASTNSFGNLTAPSTENVDENRDTKSRVLGHRLTMSQSLTRLKNKMHPMSGLKYEINTNIPISHAVYVPSNRLRALKEKDGRKSTLESESENEVEEEMVCLQVADKASEEILGKKGNRPTEPVSNGPDNNASIIGANSTADLTGYEDCVMLPFSRTGLETLAEMAPQENLVKPLPSSEFSNHHEGNRLGGSQNA